MSSGKKNAAVLLPAQVPEQPLLGDALGNPAQRPGLQRASLHAGVRIDSAVPPFALGLGDHLPEAVHRGGG